MSEHSERDDGDNRAQVTIGLSNRLSDQVDKLIDALGGQLSDHDTAVLARVLRRTEQRTKKLEGLDALTPQK